MGWTYTHLGKGQAGNEFKRMLTWDNEHASAKFIRGAFRGFREYYAAVETTDKKTGVKQVWAFIALVNWVKNDHYNFGYKDMDETCGPYSFNCPKTILELLTPTDNENANEWRKTCWERINTTPKLKDGDIVKLKNPINFRGGWTLDTFYVKKEGRRIRYYEPNKSGEMNPYSPRFLVKKSWLVGAEIVTEKLKEVA